MRFSGFRDSNQCPGTSAFPGRCRRRSASEADDGHAPALACRSSNCADSALPTRRRCFPRLLGDAFDMAATRRCWSNSFRDRGRISSTMRTPVRFCSADLEPGSHGYRRRGRPGLHRSTAWRIASRRRCPRRRRPRSCPSISLVELAVRSASLRTCRRRMKLRPCSPSRAPLHGGALRASRLFCPPTSGDGPRRRR